MTDLVEFIEARLTDDERIALAATRNAWTVDHWANDNDREFLVVADYDQGAPAFAIKSEADADHIARHDPARVLREVKAKRRTLGRHQRLKDPRAGYDLPDICGLCDVEWPCDELLDLVAPFADHPDYRSEWSPA